MSFKKTLQTNTLHNLLALYGVHFANYLLPLITTPYLARILGPFSWGLLAFTQSFGQSFNIIVEYGFYLSGTREVARNRENPEVISKLLASIMSAKMLLILLCLIPSILLSYLIYNFRAFPIIFWWGIFWACAQSLNLLWYFQGIEKLKIISYTDIICKTLTTISIFIFIRTPDDVWKALALQGTGAFLATGIGIVLAYRNIPFHLPTFSSTFHSLKMGWSMFLFKATITLYTTGNTFFLGLFVSPVIVGYYAIADKVIKALYGLLNPVNQVLYPKISHLIGRNKIEAYNLLKSSMKIMSSIGIGMGLLNFFFAPLCIRILMGDSYAPAVTSLRIFSFLPVLYALSNVLGVHWMLPLGLDKVFNKIVLIAGLSNIVFIVVLVPYFQATGMAWSVVSAEAIVTGGLYLTLIGPYRHHWEKSKIYYNNK